MPDPVASPTLIAALEAADTPDAVWAAIDATWPMTDVDWDAVASHARAVDRRLVNVLLAQRRLFHLPAAAWTPAVRKDVVAWCLANVQQGRIFGEVATTLVRLAAAGHLSEDGPAFRGIVAALATRTHAWGSKDEEVALARALATHPATDAAVLQDLIQGFIRFSEYAGLALNEVAPVFAKQAAATPEHWLQLLVAAPTAEPGQSDRASDWVQRLCAVLATKPAARAHPTIGRELAGWLPWFPETRFVTVCTSLVRDPHTVVPVLKRLQRQRDRARLLVAMELVSDEAIAAVPADALLFLAKDRVQEVRLAAMDLVARCAPSTPSAPRRPRAKAVPDGVAPREGAYQVGIRRR